MKSVEVWRKLPLGDRLHMAGLVAERSDTISATSMDEGMRELRLELRDLAAKMLEDCVKTLRDPGSYT
jgi:hypothetical protein